MIILNRINRTDLNLLLTQLLFPNLPEANSGSSGWGQGSSGLLPVQVELEKSCFRLGWDRFTAIHFFGRCWQQWH